MYTNFSFIGVYIWNDIQKHINVSVSYCAFLQPKKNIKKT